MAKQLYFPQGGVDAATYQELLRIASAIDEAGNIVFELLSAAPEFPLAYHAVAADNVNWDPLNKAGTNPYLVWYNPSISGWQEIGSQGIDASQYYTKTEVDTLLAGKAPNGAYDGQIGSINSALNTLTAGLADAVEDITTLQTDVDSVEVIVTAHTEDIEDLVTTYGSTASAAASAAAAAASQSAAAAAEAAAILAKGGAETARDAAITARVGAESAETDAGNSATAAGTSATDAAAFADDAEAAAAAAEDARVEAVAAANTAVNAAQGGVTIDPAAGALWTFDTTLQSWVSSNPTATWGTGGYLVQGTGTNPTLESPSISVNGNGYQEVVARIRRTAGSGWEGRVRYSTSGHGFSGTYEVVLSDPLLVNNEWQIVTWNFGGISDWTSSTITGLQIQLGSDSGDGAYEVDWIGVGNNIASLAQAAATSASNAAASATAAANSATAANNSAVSAASSATGAAGSASAAATSATNAATSATNSAASAAASQTDRIAAQTARSGAETAQTAAVTAQNNAATSASQAATSATNAANSATAAGGSASAASTSASNAQTSATNAANSATAAQASQVAASSSATNAANSASAASTSASSASTSASNASASATAAAGSATQASTSASNASTSASQASNSSIAAANASSNASTSAQQAANSAATATTQASSASASAASASQSASLAAQAVGTIAAVNPLNVVGNATRWAVNNGSVNPGLNVSNVNVGGRLLPALQITSSVDTQILSDEFQIDPTGIYEVRFSFLKTTSGGQMYAGVYHADVGATSFQGVLNQANSGSAGVSNPYWGEVNAITANTWYDGVFYLLGSAADVTKCPDAQVPAGFLVQTGHGLKNLSSDNRVRLRFLNWGNAGTVRTMYLTNVFVSRYDNKSSAEIKTEANVRATADSSMASQITSLQSTVNGHTSSITTLQQVDQGLTAKWTLQLNSNGHISGIQVANGGQGQSSMVFLTDRFAVAQPSGAGVVFPFSIGNINGVPTVGINGNLVVDGSITARNMGAGILGQEGTRGGDITQRVFLAAGAFVPPSDSTTGFMRFTARYALLVNPVSTTLNTPITLQLRVGRNNDYSITNRMHQRNYTVYPKMTNVGPNYRYVFEISIDEIIGLILQPVPGNFVFEFFTLQDSNVGPLNNQMLESFWNAEFRFRNHTLGSG